MCVEVQYMLIYLKLFSPRLVFPSQKSKDRVNFRFHARTAKSIVCNTWQGGNSIVLHVIHISMVLYTLYLSNIKTDIYIQCRKTQ